LSGVERNAGSGEIGGDVTRRELRMRGQKRRDDRLVLFGQHAARRVDQPSTGLDQRRRRREDRRLFAASSADASGLPPLEVGIAAQRAEPGAGRITSTRSILPARRFTLVSRLVASSCGCTFDSRERASRGVSLARRLATTSNAYKRPCERISGAKQQRLAAGARAEIARPCRCGGRDDVPDQLAAFVLHFEAAVGEPWMLRERRPAGDANSSGEYLVGDASSRRRRVARSGIRVVFAD
jgi:hypothetical protein